MTYLDDLKNRLTPLLPKSWKEGLDMQAVLGEVEKAMPQLLRDGGDWQSYYIDYEKPYLMRMFRKVQIDETRAIYVSCHYFFSPAEEGSKGISNPYNTAAMKAEIDGDLKNLTLYHPHPWAAGFHILEGKYEQGLGLANALGLAAQPPIAEWRIQSDTINDRYAFNDPHIWHAVVPQDDKPVTTLMVTYAPADWGQEGPRPPRKLRNLRAPEMDFMRDHFERIYKLPENAPKSSPFPN